MPRTSTSASDPRDGWTDRARLVADVAWRQACARGHDHIRLEHYLIALLDAGHGDGNLPSVALLVLESLNVPVDQVRHRVDTAVGDSGWPHQYGVPPTSAVLRAIEAARVERDLMGHEYIGTEHLLLGIAVEGTSLAAQVLHEFGATPGSLRDATHRLLAMRAHSRPPDADDSTHPLTLPAEVRDLDDTIAELRRRKRHAIDTGDHQAAAALRNEEKQAQTRRATAIRIWAPQVDVARLVREVEHLRAEVQRLKHFLAQHHLDTEEDHAASSGEAPSS